MNEPILPQIQSITNPKIKDIAGQRFTRLVALGYVGSSPTTGRAMWLCQCDCGAKIVVEGKELRTGNTNSCGCYHRSRAGETSRTHGMTETRLYSIWCNMRTRCQNANAPQYKNYGGRGIRVCDRWQSFENFCADMNEPPDETYTLDRIDNDGDYCPENCRWATQDEQSNNKRVNHVLFHDGKSMTICQWAKYLCVSDAVLRRRIRLGWTVDRVLTQPVRVWPSKK